MLPVIPKLPETSNAFVEPGILDCPIATFPNNELLLYTFKLGYGISHL